MRLFYISFYDEKTKPEKSIIAIFSIAIAGNSWYNKNTEGQRARNWRRTDAVPEYVEKEVD